MTELTKLEVGKTYVFKDEAAKQAYLASADNNKTLFNRHYRDGYCVNFVSNSGSGVIGGDCVINTEELKYFKLKEEPMKNIKPEDEITITTTYGELARAYAVLGAATGHSYGKPLCIIIGDIIDPTKSLWFGMIDGRSSDDILAYNKYQQEWLDALFPQETEQQKQARQLREQAEELLKKAKALEESI